MPTADKQMLQLIDILKSSGRIKFGTEFCEAIGILKQNLYKIQKGEKHFTPDHIERAVKKYKVNANWIFGVEEKVFQNIPIQ
jgi:hypothetical protein